MATTLTNVSVPPDSWVDLYAATGITVGVPIQVQNIGSADVYLTVAASQPPVGYNAYNVLQRLPGVYFRNELYDPGAWVFSPSVAGKVNVGELP